MNDFFNFIIAGGYLSDDVKLTYDDDRKTTIVKFYLKNPRQVGHNRFGNDLYIIAYGRLAEECAALFPKGKFAPCKALFPHGIK